MKKLYTIFTALLFVGVVNAQVELTLNDYTQNNNLAYNPLFKGTTDKAPDVFYIQGTVSNNTSSLVCSFGPDVTRRVQGNGIIINLKSVTELNAIMFNSNSSGSASRGILSIEIAEVLEGPYTALTDYSKTHLPLGAADNAGTCGTMMATGLGINAASTPFVKIIFTGVSSAGSYASGAENIRFFIVTLNPVVSSVSKPNFTTEGNLLNAEYYNITGSKMGSNWNILPTGIYIVKKTYDNGEVVTEKVSKARK